MVTKRSPKGQERDRMGRPPQPVPDDATVVRPYLRLSTEDWARLELAADRARRSWSAEVAVGLEAYLQVHERLPMAEPADPEHERRRVRLPPELVRRLDGLAGEDDRERHLVAAVLWWLSG
jgi:predicted DNA-binding protein